MWSMAEQDHELLEQLKGDNVLNEPCRTSVVVVGLEGEVVDGRERCHRGASGGHGNFRDLPAEVDVK